MPNWCNNTITVDHKDQSRIDEVFEYMKGERGAMDFGSIIPMPRELRNVHSGGASDEHGNRLSVWLEVDDGKGGTKNVPVPANLKQKYGHDNWYDWSCSNWGVKWNASGVEADENYVEFDTPWGPPEPIFVALSQQFPDVDFRIWWEEEQGFGEEYTLKDGNVSEFHSWEEYEEDEEDEEYEEED